MDPRKLRCAFVVPRCAEDIAGGAETLALKLAERLMRRGQAVEILATCARDNRTWENHYPPGEARACGVPLRRFPVDPRNLEVWVPHQLAIHRGLIPGIEEQLEWMEHSVNSSGLYGFIASNAERYDALFFAPYLFGTTFWGSLICPERSCLIPCLHDEPYAYTGVAAAMFRRVRGALFNSRAEMELARRLYGEMRGGEAGMGFEAPAAEEIKALEPFFAETFPYLLYVGRKETGKNVQLLIDLFCGWKDGGGGAGVKLVIAGGGAFADLDRAPALLRGDVIDLDHLSERDKQRLIRHAAVLVQPSINESFSIVLMEAWLLGTPVLVHADCAVTRDHVIESGAGLYFADQADFSGALDLLIADPGLRERMGRAGGRYVDRRYSWEAVLERFDRAMESWGAP